MILHTAPGPAANDSADKAMEKLMRMLMARNYRFIAPTPATYERINARPGNDMALDLRGVFGWSRRFKRGLLPPDMFDLMQAAAIAVPDDGHWRSTLRFSTLGDLLFAHSAYPTDHNNAVFFGPDTYRYVAAIEQHLVTHARPVTRAVDIGTGAGPGAVTIAAARPDAEVWAVDINDDALRLSAINARLAGTNNLIAAHSDLLSSVPGNFDLIVANPPYLLDPRERAYRHGGGVLGMGLSLAIVECAIHRLAPAGSLVLYTGAAMIDGRDIFFEQGTHRLREAGLSWTYREMDPDVFGEELSSPAYANVERIAAVVLTATR